LLQLRKLAREWQQEYKGLTEHNNNRVKAKKAEEEAQEEFDFPILKVETTLTITGNRTT
jgi:hypothetical protein